MAPTSGRAMLAAATLALLISMAGRVELGAQQPAPATSPAPPAGAAQGAPPPGGGGRGGAPKNVQVLKDVPPEQLPQTMQYIAASLGVQCTYCHVQGQPDLDDKEPKKLAGRRATRDSPSTRPTTPSTASPLSSSPAAPSPVSRNS